MCAFTRAADKALSHQQHNQSSQNKRVVCCDFCLLLSHKTSGKMLCSESFNLLLWVFFIIIIFLSKHKAVFEVLNIKENFQTSTILFHVAFTLQHLCLNFGQCHQVAEDGNNKCLCRCYIFQNLLAQFSVYLNSQLVKMWMQQEKLRNSCFQYFVFYRFSVGISCFVSAGLRKRRRQRLSQREEERARLQRPHGWGKHPSFFNQKLN